MNTYMCLYASSDARFGAELVGAETPEAALQLFNEWADFDLEYEVDVYAVPIASEAGMITLEHLLHQDMGVYGYD